MRFALTLAAVTGVSIGRAAAGPPVLLAADAANARLLRLDPASGAFTVVGPLGAQTVASLAYDSNRGILFGTTTHSPAESNLIRINPATGGITIVGPLGVTLMHGLEYNPADDTLYGVARPSGSPAALYRIDRSSGAATLVVPLSVTGMFGLAYQSTTGVMYVAEIFSQNLYTLDLTTGVLTLVGNFGVLGAPFVQIGMGMAFDPGWGLLATDNRGVAGQANHLYRVDMSTGAATFIGASAVGNLLGLAFVPGPCSANCDGSTVAPVLTANDFQCFVNRYAGNDPYANCDGSTVAPVLTANDFQCFINQFAAGCT